MSRADPASETSDEPDGSDGSDPPHELDGPHGSDQLGLGAAVRTGGVRTVAILGALSLVNEFDTAVLGIFAPEIQDALGLSTTALAAIGTAAGAVYVAGAVPLGRLADRTNRARIVSVATLVWAVAMAALGAARTAFWFVIARVFTGLGKSNTLPIHGSMLADAYPERARGPIYALHGTAGPIGRVLAPLTVAVLALVIDGDDAWRSIFVILAVPALVLAVVAAIWLPEPDRGAHERARVLGPGAGAAETKPIAIDMAFSRIRRIATFDRLATGIGVIGFTIFSVPIFVSLVLEEDFGLSAGERGLVTAIAALASLVAVPLGATYGGRLFQRDPARLLRLMGVSVVVASTLTATGIFMPNAPLLVAFFAAGGAVGSAAFVMLSVIVAAVVPASIRAQGFSLIGVYVFLIGGFFGSVIAGIVADSVGTRGAIPIVLGPAALVGGYLIGRAGETIGADMERVADDLREEAAEAARHIDDADVPLLQVKGLHVSIGDVAILHHVDLDVRAGEIVALVGTNGAGKSTLLRAVSGLLPADRGVIRFGPTDVTLQAAHQRTRVGMVQLSGGRSTFGPLTVRENLEVGATTVPAAERAARIERSLALFPELAPILDRRASLLSGGEQQMLGLARTLLLDPQLLLIDELSLGLAPVIVGRLVERLQAIRAGGTAIVIVEQSLNIAAAAADRVVFLDRGRVTFRGDGDELLARRDVARSVFLGAGS